MKDTSTKVLIGTVASSIKKAKVTGQLCLKELYMLNIIDGFLKECPSCISECDKEKLKKLYRQIQNKTGYICKVREDHGAFTLKFNNININNFFGEMATFNININAEANLPPSSVGDGAKTTEHATTIVFTRADFTSSTVPPYADPEGDAAALLKVITLPSGGDLFLNGVPVVAGQNIDFGDIDAGLFTYDPEPSTTTARVEPFSFAIADAGSLTFVS